MSPQNYRYPGVQPFLRSQSDRFFGREEDVMRFLSMVLQEKLSVLYGKSGYGKSSLLNAGIQPRLDYETAIKGKRRYVAVPVRFLAADGHNDENLFEQFDFHLRRAMQAVGIAPATDAVELPPTLWGCFKGWQTDPTTVFVLLFDQFEELFSYKPEQQLAFRQQLAELLYSDYPQFLEENEAGLSPETVARLAEKTNVHTVLAIRADRVSELDRMRDHLPKIRDKWFELRALPLEEAAKALTLPSALPGDFASPAFQFDASARKKILDFLRDADGFVEPNELQILAESFERRVITEGLRSFDAGNLGDLRAVIARYYSDKIAAIADPAERQAVRRLCEEGLAQEGEPPIRLSLYAAQIRQFFGIEAQLLAQLVDARLLRAEAGKGGGATYELPHDTLLEAVLEIKKQRLAEERVVAEARAAAQREAELEAELEAARAEAARAEAARVAELEATRAEAARVAELEAARAEAARAEAARAEATREKRRRQSALLLAWGAAIAALLAVGLAFFARQKMAQAEIERNKAIQSDRLAQRAKQEAVEKSLAAQRSDSLAQLDKKAAQRSDSLAQIEAAKANTALDSANVEKAARLLAEQAKQKAEIIRLLSEADTYQRAKLYKNARAKLEAVLKLDPNNREAQQKLKQLQ